MKMSKAGAFSKLISTYKTATKYPVVSVIRLQGTITAQRGSQNLNLESLRKRIDDAFKPERLAAVLVSVNSPGGSPVQSELLSSYINMKANKCKVPVTMFVEDMAASGGYWIACSGQQVFASKTSIVGSLGVIYGGLGFTELIKKVGVERRLLTSGDNKALMDPLSPVKEEDVKIIKAMLGDIHKIFIDHVKKHRGDKLKGTDEELFNGAIWTGEPAVKLGLIDGIDTVENYIQTNYGDEVKVKRVVNKYEELMLKFGAHQNINLQEMFNSQDKICLK